MIDIITKQLESMQKIKQDYESNYRINKDNYDNHVKITHAISWKNSSLNHNLNKLYIGTLPDNKDPLSFYKKHQIFKS